MLYECENYGTDTIRRGSFHTPTKSLKIYTVWLINELLSGIFKFVKQKNNYHSWKEHVKTSKIVKFEEIKSKTRENMNF